MTVANSISLKSFLLNLADVFDGDLEIEKIAFNKNCTHLDAISIYCEKMGIEPISVAKLITKSLKEKIEANARDLNYLPKSAKLPM